MTVAYPYKVHTANLSHCNIAYIDEGKGPKTLLFIHGLASYALCWEYNINELKDHYRCIAIDLPGNGFSDRGDRAYTMHFFADAVYEFIQKLELKSVCLVGHSMGGQIAMTTLINHPTCADELVLCAPAGFEVFSALEKALYQTSLHISDFLSTEEQGLRHVVQNSFYRNPQQGNGMISDLIKLMETYPMSQYRKMVEGCILSMVNEPIFDRLNSISQPTLVLFGMYDALIPNKLIHHTTTQKIAEAGVHKISGAVLKMIPDCGHFVQWEKAGEVNKYMLNFLETN
jgi:pimeloyl-ACP methyl ester carboxylesterase